MNVLERYIQEIKSVKPYTKDWTKEFDSDFVEIVVVVECYGRIDERTTVESVSNWEKIKERGYFMW